MVYGFLADHLGARRAIRLVLAVQAVALGVLLASGDLRVLAGAALLIGSFPPGIVPLALARVHQLVADHPRQTATWSRATVSFATFQALAGYGYSMLFSASGGQYPALFAVALGAIVLALLLDLSLALKARAGCDSRNGRGAGRPEGRVAKTAQRYNLPAPGRPTIGMPVAARRRPAQGPTSRAGRLKEPDYRPQRCLY